MAPDFGYDIFTSCVKRKTMVVPDELNYDKHGNYTFDEWVTNIVNYHDTRPAIDLYKGELWSVFKETYLNYATNGYVISAGCGLIDVNEHIPPYSITYCNQNFKVNNVSNPRQWWHSLCNFNKRSLADTIINSTNICILAVGSTYLNAICDDLMRINGHEKLWIITSDNKYSKLFPNNTIITSVKYRHQTGGSDVTIHVRAMRDIIKNKCTRIDAARELIKTAEMRTNINAHKPMRCKKTDNEMIEIISERIKYDSNASYTSILNYCRMNGIACQDARMSKLFNYFKLNNSIE